MDHHLPIEDIDPIFYWDDLRKEGMSTTPEGLYAYALKKDGSTVLYSGYDIVSQRFGEVGEITDLVSAGSGAFLLDSEGRAALCGQAAPIAEDRIEENPDYERILRENLKDLKQITEAGFGLKKDGTVVNLLPDEGDSENIWLQKMKGIDRLESVRGRYLIGYRSDGSVVMAETESQAFDPLAETTIEEVNSWTDIVKICAIRDGDWKPHFFGLKADGTIVAADSSLDAADG